MRKLRKIIVCIDLSKYSKDTLEYALEVALRREAELMVVNIINQKDVVSVLKTEHFQAAVDNYIKQETIERTEALRKLFKETACDHLPIKIIIKSGVPFQEIIKVVKEEDANLVVVNSKGKSDLQGVLFGSTAEKLLRHCPAPVLSLRKSLDSRE